MFFLLECKFNSLRLDASSISHLVGGIVSSVDGVGFFNQELKVIGYIHHTLVNYYG